MICLSFYEVKLWMWCCGTYWEEQTQCWETSLFRKHDCVGDLVLVTMDKYSKISKIKHLAVLERGKKSFCGSWWLHGIGGIWAGALFPEEGEEGSVFKAHGEDLSWSFALIWRGWVFFWSIILLCFKDGVYAVFALRRAQCFCVRVSEWIGGIM